MSPNLLRRLDLHSLHRLAVLARTFPIYRTLCSVSTICSSLPTWPHQLAVGGGSLHCEALQTGPGEPPDSIAPAQNINDRPAMPAPLRRTRDLLPGLAVDCSLRNFLQGSGAAFRPRSNPANYASKLGRIDLASFALGAASTATGSPTAQLQLS